MMPQNIIYNNQAAAFVYPQQQAVMQNIPIYTYGVPNPATGVAQPSAVYVQTNQTPILIQQGNPQQQFIPVTTAIMAQNVKSQIMLFLKLSYPSVSTSTQPYWHAYKWASNASATRAATCHG